MRPLHKGRIWWEPVAARRLPAGPDFRLRCEASTGRVGASIRSGLSPFRHIRSAKDRVKKSNGYTNTRHSRERACGEIEKPYKHSSFPRKRESIAAFPQGKPSRYSGWPPPDSRFRGNDEVLFGGYCLLQCRYLGDPSVTMRAVRFLHTLESGNLLRRFRKKNRADIADGRLRIPAFAGMTKYYSVVIVFYNAFTSAIRLSRSETPDFFTCSFVRITEAGGGCSQFRHASSYADGGFGNVVKRQGRDPATGETSYAEVSGITYAMSCGDLADPEHAYGLRDGIRRQGRRRGLANGVVGREERDGERIGPLFDEVRGALASRVRPALGV